ncbi:MAG TPA: beta-propeller fold lactonase family protein [Candidatus Acidoferrales bacterium]|nr:beta-propeller fold lactonase family protein [Candidatus Acidoferrales bacterium]
MKMNKTFRQASLLAVLVVGAFVPRSWADTVVVVCKSDFQLALVDPATEKVLMRLPTGRGPHEVAISPDGRTAYVSNFGRYSVYPAGDTDHDKASNTITAIDLVERKVKNTFDLGTHTGPHGMIVSHDGKIMWVTTETPQAVLELDSSSGKILHVWNTTQQRSHMIVTTPQESKFYVTNTVSGTVTVIDRSSGEVKVLPTGPGTEGIAISPDGKEVWAASRTDAKIEVISTATDNIVATFPSGGKSPKRLDFTPDGSQVWVTNSGSGETTVFDARSRELSATISTSKDPSGVSISPDGHHAYVTNSAANLLTFVDVATRKIVNTIQVGTDPDGVAWSAR